MNTNKIKDGFKLIQKGVDTLNSGPLEYYLNSLIKARELLLTKYAPFVPGDRVALRVTPEITEEKSWGWMSAKHFLIEGSKGTVKESDVSSDGKLVFYVMFDDESWLDRANKKKVPVPEAERHLFTFTEHYLRKDES